MFAKSDKENSIDSIFHFLASWSKINWTPIWLCPHIRWTTKKRQKMYRWPTNPSYIISPQFMAHTKKFLAKNFRILSGEKIKFIEQKTNSKWFFKRTKSPSDRPATDRSVSTACESLKSAKLKHVLLKVHAISSKKPHLFPYVWYRAKCLDFCCGRAYKF